MVLFPDSVLSMQLSIYNRGPLSIHLRVSIHGRFGFTWILSLHGVSIISEALQNSQSDSIMEVPNWYRSSSSFLSPASPSASCPFASTVCFSHHILSQRRKTKLVRLFPSALNYQQCLRSLFQLFVFFIYNLPQNLPSSASSWILNKCKKFLKNPFR